MIVFGSNQRVTDENFKNKKFSKKKNKKKMQQTPDTTIQTITQYCRGQVELTKEELLKLLILFQHECFIPLDKVLRFQSSFEDFELFVGNTPFITTCALSLLAQFPDNPWTKKLLMKYFPFLNKKVEPLTEKEISDLTQLAKTLLNENKPKQNDFEPRTEIKDFVLKYKSVENAEDAMKLATEILAFEEIGKKADTKAPSFISELRQKTSEMIFNLFNAAPLPESPDHSKFFSNKIAISEKLFDVYCLISILFCLERDYKFVCQEAGFISHDEAEKGIKEVLKQNKKTPMKSFTQFSLETVKTTLSYFPLHKFYERQLKALDYTPPRVMVLKPFITQASNILLSFEKTFGSIDVLTNETTFVPNGSDDRLESKMKNKVPKIIRKDKMNDITHQQLVYSNTYFFCSHFGAYKIENPKDLEKYGQEESVSLLSSYYLMIAAMTVESAFPFGPHSLYIVNAFKWGEYGFEKREFFWSLALAAPKGPLRGFERSDIPRGNKEDRKFNGPLKYDEVAFECVKSTQSILYEQENSKAGEIVKKFKVEKKEGVEATQKQEQPKPEIPKEVKALKEKYCKKLLQIQKEKFAKILLEPENGIYNNFIYEKFNTYIRACATMPFGEVTLSEIGCGVFGNDPNAIANGFLEVFSKNPELLGSFETIIVSSPKGDFDLKKGAFDKLAESLTDLINRN